VFRLKDPGKKSGADKKKKDRVWGTERGDSRTLLKKKFRAERDISRKGRRRKKGKKKKSDGIFLDLGDCKSKKRSFTQGGKIAP